MPGTIPDQETGRLSKEEKMTPGERLLLALLLFSGAALLFYLTGDTAERLGLLFLTRVEHPPFLCAACGGTRAVNYLLQGQLALAWRYNQLFVLSLPLLTAGAFTLIRAMITGRPLTGLYLRPFYLWGFLAMVLIYTLLRNIPLTAFDYLRPPL